MLGELNRLTAEDERTFCPVVVAGAKSLPVAAADGIGGGGGALAGHNADLAAMLSRACNFEVAAAASAGAQGRWPLASL